MHIVHRRVRVYWGPHALQGEGRRGEGRGRGGEGRGGEGRGRECKDALEGHPLVAWCV